MSNRLSDEKAQAIASEYCTNGFQKVMALLSVGYKKSYANNPGLKLFDNVKVKQAIAKIQAVAVVKTGFSVAEAKLEYEEARDLAKECNQPSAMVSATTGKARLYGMDKDAGVKDTVTVINVINYADNSPKRVESEVIDE